MPIHDWTRGPDYLFHNFHLSWVVALCDHLNRNVLPSTHFALSETIELRPPVGFEVYPEPDQPRRVRASREEHASAGELLPTTQFSFKRERIEYANRAVTIRSADTHAVESAILLISQQDREVGYRWESCVRHAVATLTHAIHLLVVELFPPNLRNPQSIHQAIWDRFGEEPFTLPPDKPLTVAAYASGAELTAYVEPLGVGDPLPDMPIFLKSNRDVQIQLEASYAQVWAGLPAPLKELIESPVAGV